MAPTDYVTFNWSPSAHEFFPVQDNFSRQTKKKSLSSICICPLSEQHLCSGPCTGPLMCPGGGEWARFPVLLLSRTRRSGWARPMQSSVSAVHAPWAAPLPFTGRNSQFHPLTVPVSLHPHPCLPYVCLGVCVYHMHA